MVLSGLTLRRVVSRLAFTLFVLFSIAGARAQPGDIAGTMPEDYLPDLKQILSGALQRSPDVMAKEFERLAQEARVTIANSARLPQAGGNFNYGSTQTATAGNTSSQTRDNGFFYNFGVSQAIFHWGALRNQADAARINLLVTERSFALAYRELSVLLRKTYLALIVEKARLRQMQQTLALARNDVVIATEKKERGSISSAALEGEKLTLRESTLDFNRAEAEFAKNRRRFAQLAGMAEFPEERIPLEIPRPAYSEPRAAAMTAEFLRDNAKSSLEFEIYDLRLREAELRQKIEAVRLLPKVGANANYSLENTTNVNGIIAEQRAVTRQTIGIGGSWNVFDGFATRGAKREALVAKRSLEHRKAVDIELLLQNAQNLERALKLDAELLELTDTRHGMAIEGHKRISEEVGFGLLPKGDIDRAQVGILQSSARNLEARAAFLGRWSEFVALTRDDPVLNNLPARYVREKK